MVVTWSQTSRLKSSQPELSRREKVCISSKSGEVVEKSVGGVILDSEKVVEEPATSVGEEVAEESG